MASVITRQACIKCDKGLGITTCGGCQEWFCTKHFVQHRQELAIQMDDIGQEHDVFQRDLSQDNTTHLLLSRINQWEQQSINKIKAAAEEARINLQKYLAHTKDQIKTSLNELTNDLQSSRNSDDYTEIELNKWIKQLQEFRIMLEKPTDIEIVHEDDNKQTEPIIHLIQLKEKQRNYDRERPNRLKVDNAINSDNSVIELSQEKMDELQMFRGDIVFIRGNKNRETMGMVLADDLCPNDCLRINYVLQNNIGVRLDDFALIRPCYDIKYGKRVHIKPMNNDIQKNQVNLFEVYLRPYFVESYRPVCKGDTITIQASEQPMEFQVLDTDPYPYCIVAPDTDIICEGQTYRMIKRRTKKE